MRTIAMTVVARSAVGETMDHRVADTKSPRSRSYAE